jgi:hypothetical protein
MNRQTYDALIATMDVWRWNATAPLERDLSDAKIWYEDLPLCRKFIVFRREDDLDCDGCPVKAATGFPHCVDTPFDDANACHTAMHRPGFREAARKKVEFLAALVPAGGPTE